MSLDDIYDDDFHSDEDDSESRALSDSNLGSKTESSLMPIIEVPSEGTESARTSEAPSARNLSDVDSCDDEDDDGNDIAVPYTEQATKKSRRNKKSSKNMSNHVDMTPPDKLLKRAERKAKKYAKDKNKVDKAMTELIRCTALARIVFGDGHWRLANAYANLAEGYCDLKGYFPQAQMHAEFAQDIMAKGVQLTSNSSEKPAILGCLVNIYYVLGKALTASKKYSDAATALAKAGKIANERSRTPGVSESEVEDWGIKINMALARLNAKKQKYALSITHFEKALDLLEKKGGPDNPELIPVYQNLGTVEQSKGGHADHEKAIDHFLQAHSIASTCYRENSVEVAETARALALAYANVGDETAETSGESYLNDALMIYQATYGPHHSKTIGIQDDLARLMIRTNRIDEGINMLKSTIDPKKEVFGDLSGQVADTWKLMGSTYLSQGETEKALRALKKCLTVESSVFGSNSKRTKDTQRTIDILLANPNVASKQKKSKADELKERPRFNATVSRSGALGGFKPQMSY